MQAVAERLRHGGNQRLRRVGGYPELSQMA